jgi:hypothetical protein
MEPSEDLTLRILSAGLRAASDALSEDPVERPGLLEAAMAAEHLPHDYSQHVRDIAARLRAFATAIRAPK